MTRTIITVVGKDTPGIIARVSVYLYEHRINIRDISQTIVSGIFNMLIITDTEGTDIDFDTLQKDLRAIAAQLGVDIRCQREDMFNQMHRI